jgi:fructose/tagatose bisphosphate aldolase
MPLVRFHELMAEAERGCFAVGYFESWNLDSLMAVADAAENMNSPLVLGISGAYLPDPSRKVRDHLSHYAAVSLDICRRLKVPVCLMFDESAHLSSVHSALELGFNLVTFADRGLTREIEVQVMRGLVGSAHQVGAAVEAEVYPRRENSDTRHCDKFGNAPLTSPRDAEEFVRLTGIDALAVNIGQVQCRGRRKVRLDLDRTAHLRKLGIPLVLHGVTSVDRDDLRAAVTEGIRKINVSGSLKQVYLQALRDACTKSAPRDNPHELIGSGLENDVLVAARLAMQQSVEDYLQLFGSAGKAVSPKKPNSRNGKYVDVGWSNSSITPSSCTT